MPVLARLAESCGARDVLELGPGTGNVSGAFLDAHPCRLIGAELSAGMLSKAVSKELPGVSWVRSDAHAIPLKDASVDFVFACYVLQHIRNLDGMLRECRRVLRPGGAVAFVTTSHDYIRRHPMNRYFPSFAPIDLARFQNEDAVRQALEGAGFVETGSEDVCEPRPIDKAYADRVANRFISTYDLIPEHEFREGVKRLYADLEHTDNVATDYGWEALIVHGYRPTS